jgi:hypothetical protein
MESIMMNWTTEAVRAEADYRRQALHRMASHKDVTAAKRAGGWHRWLPGGRRH